MDRNQPITVIDRPTGKAFEEKVMGEKYIRWAYQDARSSFIERIAFKSHMISKVMGAWYDSPFSKGKIATTIKSLGIDESEFQEPTSSFANFNAFFARHLKPEARPFAQDDTQIVSPADGRALVFPRLADGVFIPVKGYPFSVQKMLPDDFAPYVNGSLAILRLCPADYHRYHFPCDGNIVQSGNIGGALHSVNPVALGSGCDVFGENKRSYTLIKTEKFGTVCFVEVGAFGVGSIVNTRTSGTVAKMDEKGYFKFGGSTVIVLFEENTVTFSDDLVANSADGNETLVKVGEPLATLVVN